MSVARRLQHCKTETLDLGEAAWIADQPPFEALSTAFCCTSSAWQTRSNHWTTRELASHEGEGLLGPARGSCCTMQYGCRLRLATNVSTAKRGLLWFHDLVVFNCQVPNEPERGSFIICAGPIVVQVEPQMVLETFPPV
ncbi:hypothetical protein N431DRAFT_433140 [Stipitochalara longipes BDJ]|nr:hypothetical protein N431DRAFT_433140 [Stipitochalara longipes BDJ]